VAVKVCVNSESFPHVNSQLVVHSTQIKNELEKVGRVINSQAKTHRKDLAWQKGFEQSMGKKAFYGKYKRGPTLDDYDYF
tara:strand:- start:1262 stop:1501 length:240 start_codon:yes stop_codon:yes gene_type:complete